MAVSSAVWDRGDRAGVMPPPGAVSNQADADGGHGSRSHRVRRRSHATSGASVRLPRHSLSNGRNKRRRARPRASRGYETRPDADQNSSRSPNCHWRIIASWKMLVILPAVPGQSTHAFGLARFTVFGEIERLGPELRAEPLGHHEVLGQRHVPLRERRTEQPVAPDVAERAALRTAARDRASARWRSAASRARPPPAAW